MLFSKRLMHNVSSAQQQVYIEDVRVHAYIHVCMCVFACVIFMYNKYDGTKTAMECICKLLTNSLKVLHVSKVITNL